MKLNYKIVLIVFGILVLFITALIIQNYIINKRFAKFEQQIKQERINSILYTDSLITVSNNRLQEKFDSSIAKLQKRNSVVSTKIKKDNEKLNSINTSNIFLPKF